MSQQHMSTIFLIVLFWFCEVVPAVNAILNYFFFEGGGGGEWSALRLQCHVYDILYARTYSVCFNEGRTY